MAHNDPSIPFLSLRRAERAKQSPFTSIEDRATLPFEMHFGRCAAFQSRNKTVFFWGQVFFLKKMQCEKKYFCKIVLI